MSEEPRPYRILRLLGTGGMAQVFEAVITGAGGFERRVAIKRILADHRADGSVLRGFFDEARLASRLHHGGIVGVIDYGVAEGTPFQVLELVDGRDARTLVDAGWRLGRPLPPVLALHVCREVAHALHYAHESVDASGQRLGLVHRDVKPANVLLSWSGDVKLGDFGVAFATARREQTMQGVTKGTPEYMAPEQTQGDIVDRRADVFSLGCVLHALLAGRSPLASQATFLAVLRGIDPELAADLPSDARAIIVKATRADRRERYETAAEMAEALGEAAARQGARDVKTELIAWLSAVRSDPPPAPPPGKLDALLGAELIFSGGETHEATVRLPPAKHEGGSPPMPPASGDPEVRPLHDRETMRLPQPTRDAVAVAPPPRRRWRRAAIALTVAGALAAGGALFTTASSTPRPGLAEPPAPSAPAAPAPTPPGSTIETSAPTQEAPPASTSVSPEPPRPGPRPRATGAAPTSSPEPGGSASQAVPPAPELPATLAVGGPVGAIILVDGTRRGLTPKYLKLPVGKHRVQLVGADGAPLGSGVVDLRSDHTASAPLRWSP